MADDSATKCPVCWSSKPYSQGGIIHLSYGETAWVCSQGCADVVGSNFIDFYHNFYDVSPIGKKEGYPHDVFPNLMSFNEWLEKKDTGVFEIIRTGFIKWVKKGKCDHQGYGTGTVVRTQEEEYDHSDSWVTEMFGHWRSRSVGVTFCENCGKLLEIGGEKPTWYQRWMWKLHKCYDNLSETLPFRVFEEERKY